MLKIAWYCLIFYLNSNMKMIHLTSQFANDSHDGDEPEPPFALVDCASKLGR